MAIRWSRFAGPWPRACQIIPFETETETETEIETETETESETEEDSAEDSKKVFGKRAEKRIKRLVAQKKELEEKLRAAEHDKAGWLSHAQELDTRNKSSELSAINNYIDKLRESYEILKKDNLMEDSIALGYDKIFQRFRHIKNTNEKIKMMEKRMQVIMPEILADIGSGYVGSKCSF